MTQPIGPYAQSPWREDDGESSPSAPPVFPAINDPPEPPELPDVDAQLLARLATFSSSSPNASPMVQALATLHRARDAQVQQRLDVFRTQAIAAYHTPSGDVRVAPPFRIGGQPIAPDNQRFVAEAGHRLGLSDADVARLLTGRGTPEQVQAVTQALIDAGRLPPASDSAPSIGARIRLMMYQHGVGFDCAGYVAQAFLASRSVDRPHSQLRDLAPENDQLCDLQSRGFVRVDLDATRPGDVIVLGKSPADSYGHRVIVYAARDATLDDRATLLRLVLEHRPKMDPQRDLLKRLAGSASLRVLVVDSSWGNNGDPQRGGVERKIWWHSQATGQWAGTDPNGAPVMTDGPYNHPVEGAYRPQGEP
jgi:cell wall-associated NlpC family hydrolase